MSTEPTNAALQKEVSSSKAGKRNLDHKLPGCPLRGGGVKIAYLLSRVKITGYSALTKAGRGARLFPTTHHRERVINFGCWSVRGLPY
jgi:hypothetical protein